MSNRVHSSLYPPVVPGKLSLMLGSHSFQPVELMMNCDGHGNTSPPPAILGGAWQAPALPASFDTCAQPSGSQGECWVAPSEYPAHVARSFASSSPPPPTWCQNKIQTIFIPPDSLWASSHVPTWVAVMAAFCLCAHPHLRSHMFCQRDQAEPLVGLEVLASVDWSCKVPVSDVLGAGARV